MLASLGIAEFLSANAFGLATVLGAVFVWLLSHAWPAFNDLSQNADGTPSFLGTWAKRGTTFLATWCILLLLRRLGAAVPEQMVAEIGLFWTQFLEALVGAAVSGTTFKLAKTSPKKG